MGTLRRIASSLVIVAAAAAVVLPSLHLWFEPAAEELDEPRTAPRARALLARQLAFWEEGGVRDDELARMRPNNPEWDFMGRTYLVMALANEALARPPGQRARYLAAMDRIIEDTLALEEERGIDHFLLPYLRTGVFRSPVDRSIAIDGEVGMMLATRQLVAPSDRWAPALAARVEHLEAHFETGPVLSGESYPNECWTFCNTFALAALRVADAAAGTDAHRDLGRRWLGAARAHLVDPETGMLVSSFTWDGRPLDGPEGSSIFMSAHNLTLVDETFARDQFERARAHLSRQVFGFGWAREWPDTWVGPADIDSGPVVPVVGASAGSSGLAILGAAAFGDREMLGRLLTSLDFAAFPIEDATGLRYAAGNQVGDAVLLYSLTYGPLVEEARRRNDLAGGVS